MSNFYVLYLDTPILLITITSWCKFIYIKYMSNFYVLYLYTPILLLTITSWSKFYIHQIYVHFLCFIFIHTYIIVNNNFVV